jgi:hypothetical protein
MNVMNKFHWLKWPVFIIITILTVKLTQMNILSSLLVSGFILLGCYYSFLLVLLVWNLFYLKFIAPAKHRRLMKKSKVALEKLIVVVNETGDQELINETHKFSKTYLKSNEQTHNT